MKPRYVTHIDPVPTTTTSCSGTTVTYTASVTVVRVPWWKWWAK